MLQTINNIALRPVESTVHLCVYDVIGSDRATLFNNMNGICCIYKITNPKGLVYIGQTIDLEKRTTLYRRLNCKRQTKLYNSILKYGWENHKVDIVQMCKEYELNDLEKYYVDLFQSFNRGYGLNLRDGGGSHGKMSEESKARMSIARKGKKQSPEHIRKRVIALTGRKKSPSTIEKLKNVQMNLSAGQIERRNAACKMATEAWRGNHHTKQHKEYISMILKGRKRTSEHCANISKAKKGITPSYSSRVIDMLTGIIYESVSKAGTAKGVPYQTLYGYLNGKHPNKTTLRFVEKIIEYKLKLKAF